MTDPRDAPRTARRRFGWPAALVAALLALAGCAGADTGEVTGTVTVDGQTPADGSSITFLPTGKTAGGGGPIQGGKYAVTLPVGSYKVEIRVPRPIARGAKAAPTDGPGPGGPADIEESLPAKYNDKTELTFDVKPGRNPDKNWELKR